MNGRQNKQKQKSKTWFELNEDKALSLLIDYYNLRLQITEEDDKLTLSDKEAKKVTDFFLNHPWLSVFVTITGTDFDRKFPPSNANPNLNFAKFKQLHDDASQETDDKQRQLKIRQLKGHLVAHGSRSGDTFGAKVFFERIMWRESEGFQEFLSDYQRITAIVTDAVEKEILSPESFRWIENLAALVHSNFVPGLNHQPKTNNLKHYWKCYTENWEIDLKRANVIDFPHFPHDWYGADFGRFVYFIYKGLLKLLSGEVQVKECKFPHCGKFFVMSSQGRYEHKFCDENCRRCEERRPHYEDLATYIAEWLQTQKESKRTYKAKTKRTYKYKAKTLAESLEQYVREKHTPDFSLTAHQVGVEFREQHLNPYLQKHGFWCKREGERRPYDYTFEKFNQEYVQ